MPTVYSGIVLRLLPKTAFDFSKITAGNSQTLTLAQHIDVAPFTEATFILRAHAVSIAGGATIDFNVLIDGFDFDDPGVTGFLQPNNAGGGAIAQLNMTNATTAPFFANLSVPSNYGRFLALQLSGVVPGGGVGGTCTISVDLSLKGGDPTARAFVPNSFLGYAMEAPRPRIDTPPQGRVADVAPRLTQEYAKALAVTSLSRSVWTRRGRT